MTRSPCDDVVERTALGEPLAELADHAASCERCTRLLELPASLARAAHAADPGIGFSSRATAGAQHRIAVRRHRRIAGAAAMSVAAAAVVALVVTRQPDRGIAANPPVNAVAPAHHQPEPTNPNPSPHEVDPDVRALVDLANVDRELHVSTHWGRIEASLKPYRAVLEGKAP
jgi:hypothetical protein